MFAEPSSEWVGGFATPSFTCSGSVNNLLIIDRQVPHFLIPSG